MRIDQMQHLDDLKKKKKKLILVVFKALITSSFFQFVVNALQILF